MPENMPPLDDELRELIEAEHQAPEMPAAIKERLRANLAGVRRVLDEDHEPPAGDQGSGAGRRLWQKPTVVAVSAFVLGLGAGALLHASWAPRPATPQLLPSSPPAETASPRRLGPHQVIPQAVIEERPVALDTRPPKPRAESDARDLDLAGERGLIEMARSAIARGQNERGMEALQQHLRRFPYGRLAEERESLWIQALINIGQASEARLRAQRFRSQFPHSLLLPMVDSALQSPP